MIDLYDEILARYSNSENDPLLRDLEYSMMIIRIMRTVKNPDEISCALTFLMSLFLQDSPDARYLTGKKHPEFNEDDKYCVKRILLDELSLL